MKTKQDKQQTTEHARKVLLRNLQDGTRIYTTLRHVSKSGLTRYIRAYVGVINSANGMPMILDITWYYAQVSDRGMTDRGVRFGGCGFDAGYEVKSDLERLLNLKLDHENL